MKISIVAPIFNEEKVIPEFYKRLTAALKKDFKRWDYEIIFIDDGSNDTSYKILESLHKKNNRVKVLVLTKNFGQHNAISAGLQFVSGDYTVILDCDLQDRPEEIINLYKKLRRGYNIVYSVRKQNNASLFKKVTSHLFWISLGVLTGLRIPPHQSMLKIFDQQVFEKIKAVQEASPFYPVLFSRLEMKQSTKLVKNDNRFGGESKYDLRRLLQLASIAVFYYSYKRLCLFYFTTAFVIQIITVIILLSNHIVSSLPILISLQILFLLQTIVFVLISKSYFTRTEKNYNKNSYYVIKSSLQ